jgi:small subunit ribosomal protein S6e
MVFKINLSDKTGKTYKFELDSEFLPGKELHEKIEGKELLPALDGYELEITGASDKAGFPSLEHVDGTNLKRVLLTYGKGMKKRPKREGKKKRSTPRPKGLRLRKTVRGKILSQDTVQVNIKVLKHGKKSLHEIFPEQNQPKAKPEKPAEVAAE